MLWNWKARSHSFDLKITSKRFQRIITERLAIAVYKTRQCYWPWLCVLVCNAEICVKIIGQTLFKDKKTC